MTWPRFFKLLTSSIFSQLLKTFFLVEWARVDKIYSPPFHVFHKMATLRKYNSEKTAVPFQILQSELDGSISTVQRWLSTHDARDSQHYIFLVLTSECSKECSEVICSHCQVSSYTLKTQVDLRTGDVKAP